MVFQGSFHPDLDRGPLLSFPTLCGDLVQIGWAACVRVCFLEPLVQQWLKFAHVLKTELKCLEPADSGLRKDVSVESTQCQTNVRLREAQLDSTLLELFGKLLQVVRAGCVLVGMVLVMAKRLLGGLHLVVMATCVVVERVSHVVQRAGLRAKHGVEIRIARLRVDQ